MLVEIVKELLVVVELGVPLAGLHIPEVIPQRNQENRSAEEAGFLPVLIQQQVGSRMRPVGSEPACPETNRLRPGTRMSSSGSGYSPFLDIPLCDWLRRDPPRAGDAPPRQTVEVELAADGRVGAACVRHIIAVERHHVARDVAAVGGV